MSFRPAHLLLLGVPAALVAATLVVVTNSSGAAADPKPDFHRPAFTGKQSAKPEFEPNTVLVKFKTKTTTSARRAAVSKFGATTENAVTSKVVELKGTASAPDLLKKVKADPAVELASLNYVRRISAVPNDPYFNDYQKDSLTTSRVTNAWDVSKSTGSQIVAVLDTGVDAGHPDLAGHLVAGVNTTSPNRGPIDDNGHGTMTLGIIAAGANNGIGVAGVGWSAKAMPVKVLNSEGEGYDLDIAEGIDWAVAHGAKVINMSLGGPGFSPVLEQAVQNAYAQGVVIVASSGNDGSGIAQYPAAFPEVIAVGATDPFGSLTEFSSFGNWVDLAAPGWNILSTYPRVPGDPEDVPYAWCTGTSCSAPIVAGVAALLRNKAPTFTAAQVATQLKTMARDAGPRGTDPYYGAGILDGYSTLGGRFTPDFPGGAADGNDQPARATKLTGTSTTSTIGTEGDVDWFAVDSAAARNLKVSVTGAVYDVFNNPQNVGPAVDVYDENLKLLGHDENVFPPIDPNTGWPQAVALTASTQVSAAAGTTYVAVRNTNGSRDERQYQLSVTEEGAGGTATGPAYPIRDVAPANLSSGAAAAVKPSVTFARVVDASTVTASTVKLANGKTGADLAAAVDYDAATRTATLTPAAALLDATSYKIVVSGVQEAGAAEVPAITTAFTTADLAPQKLTTFATTGAHLGATVSWTIPATPDLDQVVVRRNVGGKTPTPDTGTIVYAGTGTSVKLTGMAQGTTYTFAAWVKDRSGKFGPGWATQLVGTRTGITTTSTLISHGGTITLKGSMLGIDGKPRPGEAVQIHGRAKNVTSFKLLATLKTASNGMVSFDYKPTVSTVFAVYYPGNVGLMGARTPDVLVQVMPVVTTALSPSTIKLGQTAKFSGKVTPAHYKKPVQLQLSVAGKWVTVATTTQATTGAYAFTIKPTKKAKYAYRVVHPADADHAQTVTPYRNLTVN